MKQSLKQICKDNGITLTELGRRINKSKQYMSELARGNIKMTYDMAVDIATSLDTTPDKIFLPTKSNNIGLNSTGTEGGV